MAAVAAAGAEAAAKAAIAAGATTTVMVAPPPPQEYEEFNPYLFIKMLPPYHTVAPAVPRIALVKKNKRCGSERARARARCDTLPGAPLPLYPSPLPSPPSPLRPLKHAGY